MPCNSVSVASVQVSNLAELTIQQLTGEPGDLRQALEQMFTGQLEIAGWQVERAGNRSFTAKRDGGRVTIALYEKRAQAAGASWLRQEVVDALAQLTAETLQTLGATLLAELLKGDMLDQGIEITNDDTTAEGVRVLDFRYEVQ